MRGREREVEWDGQRKDRFTLALKSSGNQGGYGICVHTCVVCVYTHVHEHMQVCIHVEARG